jgi:hypothetical protein
MKTLIFLGALAVVGLVVTGAIKLQKSSDNTLSIQIDENRVKQDAGRVVEEGKHVFQEAESSLNQATQENGQK